MSRSGSGLGSLQAWFEKRQSERPVEALEFLRAQVSKLKIVNYKNLVQILEREADTPEHEAEALRVMLKGGSFTEAVKAAQGLPYEKPGELMSLWAWFARRLRKPKLEYTRDIIDEQIDASNRAHEQRERTEALKGLVGFLSWWLVFYLISHYLGGLWGAAFMGATVGFFVGALYTSHRQDELLKKLGVALVQCRECGRVSLGPRELYSSDLRCGLCYRCLHPGEFV